MELHVWLPVALLACASIAGAVWVLRRRVHLTWENVAKIEIGMPRAAVEKLLGGPPGDYAGSADRKFVVAEMKPDDKSALTQIGNTWNLHSIRDRRWNDDFEKKPRKWWLGDGCIVMLQLDKNDRVLKIVIARVAE